MRVLLLVLASSLGACDILDQSQNNQTETSKIGEADSQGLKEISLTESLKEQLKQLEGIDVLSDEEAVFYLHSGVRLTMNEKGEFEESRDYEYEDRPGNLYIRGNRIWTVTKTAVNYYDHSRPGDSLADKIVAITDNFNSSEEDVYAFPVEDGLMIFMENSIVKFTINQDGNIAAEKASKTLLEPSEQILNVQKIDVDNYLILVPGRLYSVTIKNKTTTIQNSIKYDLTSRETASFATLDWQEFSESTPFVLLTEEGRLFFRGFREPELTSGSAPSGPDAGSGEKEKVPDVGEEAESFDPLSLARSHSIGGPSLMGSVDVQENSVLVQGAGADIFSTADEFHFYNLRVPDGDFTIETKVSHNNANADDYAKFGLMIRNNLNANASHVLMALTGDNFAHFQKRTSNGASVTAMPRHTDVGSTGELFLRLVKSGSNVTGFYSLDGVNYTEFDAASDVTFNGNVRIGFAVSSHDIANLNVAQFDTKLFRESLEAFVQEPSP